jgi:microcystin-dependent protein
MHVGNNGIASHVLGEKSGTETVTLTSTQMPVHNHVVVGSGNAAASGSPTNAVPAVTTGKTFSKASSPALRAMASRFLAPQGGSLPHENMQPSLVVTFIIALEGVYPTQ